MIIVKLEKRENSKTQQKDTYEREREGTVRVRKIISIFAIFLTTFLLFPLFTSTNLKSLYADTTGSTDTNHPGFTFSTILATGKATITGYDATTGGTTPTIPDSLQINGAGTEFTVTSIGEMAFLEKTITSIVIPSGVKSIGVNAFTDCHSLASVTFAPTSTLDTISNSAFYNCWGLTSITIPSGVTIIDADSFYGCNHLTSVSIPQGVTSIGLRAFSGCTILTSVTIPSIVTSIGASAFFNCWGLTSITIPSSVITIGNYAFSGCKNLAEVTFKRAAAPTFGTESFGTVGRDVGDDPIAANAKAYVPAGSTGYINTSYPFISDNPLKLTVAGSDSPASGGSGTLTPDEWVTKNLNIDQMVAHYGATSTGFLGMLYDNSMQRIPDSSGLIYWNEKLNLHIYGANFVVEHFLFSDEIGAKVAAMSSVEYVNFLYSTLFARVPDADGYNNWLGYLNGGFSKEETLRAFLNNQEWISICNLFNVTP